jgi:hypothetical protein
MVVNAWLSLEAKNGQTKKKIISETKAIYRV